ncbi:hypothetical protein [Rhizobium sp. P32RR-XVIII]|uniref:hypothetical protein n=1 Tax=Rhizobium sp. P32RR-XVIII TaxID=2726738 RepID=UPI001FED759E|nr:hypothetical protein [Rhizobium sp. P32RR-XVIII]
MGISAQADLFGAATSALPAGFRYQPDVVPEDVQSDLLRELPQLPLKPFKYGFEGITGGKGVA